jgi:hypothetical protein
MPKLIPKTKKLAFICMKCFTKTADKLAWFVSKNSIWNESLLCRICFNGAFNKLNNNEKGEWYFYAKNNASKTTRD